MTLNSQMPTHSTRLRAGSVQAQASLTLSIPNYLPSRQGKSLEAISKIFLSLALSLLALSPFGYAQGKLCRSVEGVGFIKGFYFTLNFGMVWMSFSPFRLQLEDRIKVNRRIHCIKSLSQ